MRLTNILVKDLCCFYTSPSISATTSEVSVSICCIFCTVHFILDCAADHFRCSNGFCVANNVLCDGKDDCQDHSDEYNCSKCLRANCINSDCILVMSRDEVSNF